MSVNQFTAEGHATGIRTAPVESRARLNVSAIALTCGPTLLFLALTVCAKFYANISIGFFSRDPMATLQGHPLTGIQSTLGVLVWGGAAAICFFSCLALQRVKLQENLSFFLFWSGVISIVLALDDMFLIHEDLAYRYLSVNEKVVVLVYGCLVAWFAIKFRRNILATDYSLLLLAFVFFGSSVFIDMLNSKWSWSIFFEDGFKLLGIVTWSGYLIRTCLHALAPRLSGALPTPVDISR